MKPFDPPASNRIIRSIALPLLCSWAISANSVLAMDENKGAAPVPSIPARSVNASVPLQVVPVAAPASASQATSKTSPPSTATSTASAKPAAPAPPVNAGQAQTTAPSANAGRQAAPFRSRDSQNAMDALQGLNPSGWTASATKIFMPGIEASAESTLKPLATNLSPAEEDAQQKAVSNAPQFMPFEQLTSEVEAQRVAILKEFRCNSVYSKNYKRGQRQISARIYQFSNPESAYGAYSLLRQGASTVVKRGDASSEDDQGISFWQGRTFVSIYGTSIDDDESKDVVRSMADKFSSVLKEHAALPQILEQLPRLDIVKGSEHIVMGTLSARRFSPAPFLNYLDFSHAAAAATADYQIQSPPDRLRLLYVDFEYPGYAAAAYRAYTENFGGRAVPLEEPLMGQTGLYKVNGTFILCQQVGGRLAIISGARKKQSAAVLARFLH